ncbi:metallophosphoesterase [Gaopeijia maritima]|uniref:Metallophosphoesterase n=1 Tax=Gaopeijia maritima TaxID=3119007 RepID=A0ABU9ECA4_9BACT
MLTDLHLKAVTHFHERIARAVEDSSPNAVVIIGDAVDGRDRLPLLSDFLGLLPGSVPRVATLGNWEYWGRVDLAALRRTYEAADTHLLVNESYILSEGAALFGTDDSLAGTPTLDGLVDLADREVVLLSHCPAFRDAIPAGLRGQVRAMLSGHTHGGQVAIGGWAPLLPPGSGPYTAGWYTEAGVPLYVSRGLGTSVLPLRLGSPPELAVLEWFVGGLSGSLPARSTRGSLPGPPGRRR